MDKIQAYLAQVPIAVVLAAVFVAVVGFLVIPPSKRLAVTITVAVLALGMGKFPELGAIAFGAKATGFAAFIAVIVAAYIDPSPKARLAPAAWAYPAIICFGFAFILTVDDLALALVLQFQFLLLAVAAILTVRTIRDEASLMRVLWAFWIGLFVVNGVAFAFLILHPAEALRAGLGRFEPWGANSNQSGVLFSALAPLSIYLALRVKGGASLLLRLTLFGAAALALGMGLLSGSRSTMITMLMASIPLMLVLGRRLVVGVVAGALLAGGVVFVLSRVKDNPLDRFESLDTGRVETADLYIREVIAERPLTGLLGTSGKSFLREDDVGHHPHNAYIELAYVGGITYLLPFLTLAIITGVSSIRIWLQRKRLDADPLLISFLCFQMAALYAHGMVNGAIYYPTYEWAFLHFILSVFFLSAAFRMRIGEPVFALPGEAEYHEYGYEYADPGYTDQHDPYPAPQ